MAAMVLFDSLHSFSQAILAVPEIYILGNSWLLNAGVKEAALQCSRHKFRD